MDTTRHDGNTQSPFSGFWSTVRYGLRCIGNILWGLLVLIAERPRLVPTFWFVTSTPVFFYMKGKGDVSSLELFSLTYFGTDMVFWIGGLLSMGMVMILMTNPPISVQLASFGLMLVNIAAVMTIIIVNPGASTITVRAWLQVIALSVGVLGGLSAMVLLVKLTQIGEAIPDAVLEKRGVKPTTIR